MGTEIRVRFFDGISELVRVCSIHGAKSYIHYYVYDVYEDETITELYSGSQRIKALRLMQETANLLLKDEAIIMGR